MERDSNWDLTNLKQGVIGLISSLTGSSLTLPSFTECYERLYFPCYLQLDFSGCETQSFYFLFAIYLLTIGGNGTISSLGVGLGPALTGVGWRRVSFGNGGGRNDCGGRHWRRCGIDVQFGRVVARGGF